MKALRDRPCFRSHSTDGKYESMHTSHGLESHRYDTKTTGDPRNLPLIHRKQTPPLALPGRRREMRLSAIPYARRRPRGTCESVPVRLPRLALAGVDFMGRSCRVAGGPGMGQQMGAEMRPAVAEMSEGRAPRGPAAPGGPMRKRVRWWEEAMRHSAVHTLNATVALAGTGAYQPDTPDMVPRRLYGVMSPDTLYPRQGSWQGAEPAATTHTCKASQPQTTIPQPTTIGNSDGCLWAAGNQWQAGLAPPTPRVSGIRPCPNSTGCMGLLQLRDAVPCARHSRGGLPPAAILPRLHLLQSAFALAFTVTNQYARSQVDRIHVLTVITHYTLQRTCALPVGGPYVPCGTTEWWSITRNRRKQQTPDNARKLSQMPHTWRPGPNFLPKVRSLQIEPRFKEGCLARWNQWTLWALGSAALCTVPACLAAGSLCRPGASVRATKRGKNTPITLIK